VRRIEALTGPGAYTLMRERERSLARAAELLRTPIDSVERRVQQLAEERRTLEKKLEDALRGGGDELQKLIASATPLGGNGARLVLGEVRVDDAKALQGMGDALREQLSSGVAVLAARLGDGKGSLLAVVTDDLRARGLRADAIVRDVAAIAGGRGGGKPHMAQAGIPDASRIEAALSEAPKLIAALLANA
jgi:alanyl-tRNA synthetase